MWTRNGIIKEVAARLPTMFDTLKIALAKLTLVLLQAQVALAVASTPARPTTAQIWAAAPDLKLACSCESWGDPNLEPRQFTASGTILWGNDPKTGLPVKRDAGACQINTKVHALEIKAEGLNVLTNENDNIYFAWELYQRSGMQPWAASKSCWQKAAVIPEAVHP